MKLTVVTSPRVIFGSFSSLVSCWVRNSKTLLMNFERRSPAAFLIKAEPWPGWPVAVALTHQGERSP